MSAELERVKRALEGQYDIEREIGAGGMATVYLAHDRKHERTVAVKVLRPDLAAAVGGERFLHEIKLTAQLNHPHILSLIDSGEADGLLYYVMPYIQGESLRELLERERQLPIDEALRITSEVAEGLEHAHRKGVVHRDIKPENILISDEHAVIADFGIAHGVSEAGGERLTATGIAVGTPAYMSPEQAGGERDIDARSDVYALGCVLYEMLVGEPPFTGPTTQAIIARKSLDAVPNIRTVRETVSEGINASVAKALARVPADRYQSTSEFVAALAEPYVSVVPVAPRKRKTAMVLGLAGMVVVGGLALWRWMPPGGGLTLLPEGSTIAVIPLAPSSPDAELSRLGRDLVTTLSWNLSNVGDIRAVNSQSILSLAGDAGKPHTLEESVNLATQLGASSFLHGTVLRRGDDARVIVALYDTRDTTELARTSVTAPLQDVTVFADSIAVDILRQIWRKGDPVTPSLATTLTGSPEALRHFVAGENAFAENRWDDAEAAYASAFRADTTFWLASFMYAYIVTGWTQSPVADTTVLHAFHARIDQLPEPYRSWLDVAGSFFGLEEFLYADSTVTSHLQAYGQLVDRYPDYWQILFDYADGLVHYGSLFGVSGEEALNSWRRLVQRHPTLISDPNAGPRGEFGGGWFHVLWLSMARDSALTARGLEGLRSASGRTESPPFVRLLNRAVWGTYDTLLIDTVIATRLAPTGWFNHANFLWGTSLWGLHQLQLEVSDRKLRDELTAEVAAWHHLSRAAALASRGSWDSALVAADQAKLRMGSGEIPLWRYRIAVVGAWLGMLRTEQAVDRRPDTAAFAAGPSGWRGELAWLDGLVGFARVDPPSLASARSRLAELGADSLGPMAYYDGSLAALELGLSGAVGPAADAMYRIEFERTGRESYASGWFIMHEGAPFLHSVNRLAGSRWLLAEGDTTRTLHILGWHVGNQGFRPVVAYAFVAALGYRELALIADAQGRTHDAIEYYREFLRRYDMPPPQHRQWVEDANEALLRLISTDRQAS